MISSNNDKLLVYFESEEHLVRRLGAAVVSCWKDLDHTVRETLIERAKRILDYESDEELEAHIRSFVTLHDRQAAAPRRA